MLPRASLVCLVAGVALCAVPLAGQSAPPGPVVQRSVTYSSQQIGTDDGLPQLTINAMLMGDDGALWLATYGGLARFDGRRFRALTVGAPGELATPRLLALARAPSGALWVGAQQRGVGLVEGATIRQLWSDSTARTLNDMSVFAILHDAQGGTWLATDRGLLHREPAGAVRRLWPAPGEAPHAVYRIVVDTTGALWATAPGLLLRVRDGVVDVPPIDRSGLDFPWAGLFVGPDRSVYVSRSSPGGEILRWTGTAFVPALRGFLAADDRVRSVSPLGGGRVGIGTSAGELLLWTGDSLLRVEARHLGASPVLQVLDRPSGGYWVATDADGLVVLTLPVVRHFDAAPARLPAASAVLVDARGVRWAALGCPGVIEESPRGVVRRHDLGSCVLSLHEAADDALWVGTASGLYRWRRGAALAGAPLVPGVISALHQGRDGRLWVGGEDGVHVVVPDGAAWRVTSVPGMPPDRVHQIHVAADGRLRVGAERGLWMLDTAQGALVRVPGMADVPVRALHVDPKGHLWVGTYGVGLWHEHEGRLVRLGTDDGLPENIISWIGDDGAGFLWLTGNRGVHRVALAALYARVAGQGPPFAAVSIERSTDGDPLEANGGNQPAGAWHPDGTLLVPTIYGPVVLDPARIPTAAAGPRVQLDDVVIDQAPAVITDAVLLPPGTQRVVIGVSAIEFDHPASVAFQYRLLPYDRDWVSSTTGRAVYTELPPGEYTFEARAISHAGLPSPRAVTLRVTQQPRFTQTMSFVLLLLVAMLGTAVAAAAWWSAAARRRALRLQREVDQAIAELRVLKGLLPICAWCKQVRDDSGAWTGLEQYIVAHSEAEWTHSICAPCASKVFGPDGSGPAVSAPSAP